jgi:hypothetical protein
MADNTFDILERAVAEAKCKPGWSFRLYDEDGALRLVIRIDGVHNYDHSKRFVVDHYHPVPITTTTRRRGGAGYSSSACAR